MGKHWLSSSPSRFPLPPSSSPPVPLDFSSSVSPFSVPGARSAVSNLGRRRWKWLEAARPPGLCAPRSRCPQRPQLPAPQKPAPGLCRLLSPELSLGRSLLGLGLYLGEQGHMPDKSPGMQGSPRGAAQRPAGWLSGLWVCSCPVQASAGAGGAGRPEASWRAAARGPGARPRPPGLHWIRPEKVSFPETSLRPMLGG